MKKGIVFIVCCLLGCSTAELINTWKNPEVVVFDAYKVLVVGMTPNEEGRELFETKMKRELTQSGVEAMRSIDLFDVEFTNSPRTEEELNAVEQQLLEKDFDAILFTKVLGSENRQSFAKRIADIEGYEYEFQEDYLTHQNIYFDDNYYEEFTVYHAETSLYCICIGKERRLIWRGSIDITDPINIRKAVDDYIRLLVVAMTEEDVIFHEADEEEIISR
ncbi:MAG: hypothetical protein KJO94_08250 [Eudoraea sp.]|nr:hypothetical protein [Eudoraea sp.]MBT8323455.1 hypothetical protein [Eudoraea sp.]NNJ40420.1 hypothetical protein [Eudoraea sp.]